MSEPAPKKILVRSPNWVGDVLMVTPALRALRHAHPKASIAVVGRPYVEGLLRGLPAIDRFLPEPERGLRATLAFARALRAERFDWAVLFPDSASAAAAPFLARIPVRAGYARDPLRRSFLTQALPPPSEDGKRIPISMLERYRVITRALGCPDVGDQLDVAVHAEARESAAEKLREKGVEDGAGLLVITPGASFGASKLWPAEHFASAADGIEMQLGLRTVLAPGPGEEPVALKVAEQMKQPPVLFTDPTLSLPELVALLERSRLLLSNDTGPRHIAVALDRPVVTVMGPTDPRHTHHLMEQQRVLREPVSCSPCHLKICPIDHRCMTRLLPERAVAAAVELLT